VRSPVRSVLHQQRLPPRREVTTRELRGTGGAAGGGGVFREGHVEFGFLVVLLSSATPVFSRQSLDGGLGDLAGLQGKQSEVGPK